MSSENVRPPVSIILKFKPLQCATAMLRVRVVPAMEEVIASEDLIILLKRVDFPTLTRPTRARVGRCKSTIDAGVAIGKSSKSKANLK
jgi:hypothetical protein